VIDEKDLKQLDLVEGHPDLYRRTPRTVITDDGFSHEVWVYYLRPKHINFKHITKIKGGEYVI
jgi:gamma-glutamylcyclotransferase (GGCT)/AIG2-like uncharacterized protein YtfP